MPRRLALSIQHEHHSTQALATWTVPRRSMASAMASTASITSSRTGVRPGCLRHARSVTSAPPRDRYGSASLRGGALEPLAKARRLALLGARARCRGGRRTRRSRRPEPALGLPRVVRRKPPPHVAHRPQAGASVSPRPEVSGLMRTDRLAPHCAYPHAARSLFRMAECTPCGPFPADEERAALRRADGARRRATGHRLNAEVVRVDTVRLDGHFPAPTPARLDPSRAGRLSARHRDDAHHLFAEGTLTGERRRRRRAVGRRSHPPPCRAHPALRSHRQRPSSRLLHPAMPMSCLVPLVLRLRMALRNAMRAARLEAARTAAPSAHAVR